MKKEFREALEDSPVIAAIKDDAGLEKCLTCDSRIIFILYGDVITIPKIVDRVRSAGKIAMVHIDLIQGLSSREVAVDFIHTYTSADGIISTRAPLIQRPGNFPCTPSCAFSCWTPWLLRASKSSSAISVPTWWKYCPVPCPAS